MRSIGNKYSLKGSSPTRTETILSANNVISRALKYERIIVLGIT